MDAFLNIQVENLNHWHQNSHRARQNIAGAHKSHNTECKTFQRAFKSKAILKSVIFAGGGAPLTAVFWFFCIPATPCGFSCGINGLGSSLLLLRGFTSYSTSPSTLRKVLSVYFTNQQILPTRKFSIMLL